MMNLLAVTGIGFLLGMRHATDPDHVIAVATIVSGQRSVRHASLIGLLWGLGHTITIFLVGAGIILFNLVIPPRVGLAMELAVGVMLIFLGMLNLSGVTQWITHRLTPTHSHDGAIHAHPHSHGNNVHTHVHGHNPEVHLHLEAPPKPQGAWQKTLARVGVYQMLRPLTVGIVHGLAGSAAVALLVLTTIRDPRWAVLYLVVFGIGTAAGMMLITMIISAPLAYSGNHFKPFNRGLTVASGLISVAFGLFVTFQIGLVDGLFGANPHWTPR